MKAVFVTEKHELKIVDRKMPKINGANDVLIRITSAGICSADLEIAAGIHPFASYPIILGHEFGGIVEETGSGVTKVKPGDKVTVDPVTSCGKCYSCRKGRPNICLNLKTYGVHRDGGFCQYIVVPQSNVYRYTNQEISQQLLGLAEPYSIGAQINLRAKTGKDDCVLIMGAGPIGLCALQVAKSKGARVIVSDLIDQRLENALSMGADAAVNLKTHTLQWLIEEYLNGEGADVVINTVSKPSSLSEAVDYAAYGGRIVIVGLSKNPSHIAQSEIVKKELTILGSRLSNRLFPEVVSGIDKGELRPQELCSHYFYYTEIEQAFKLIKEKPEQVRKIVLHFK